MIALRYIPTALAALALGAALWWGWSVLADRARLADENARLTRSIAAMELQAEQAKIAREVEAARADYERQQRIESERRVHRFLTDGGIPDALLDPAVAAWVNGLRHDD